MRETKMAARVADHAWDATTRTIRDAIVDALSEVPPAPLPDAPIGAEALPETMAAAGTR